MKLSILIPNYNSEYRLVQCVDAIRKNPPTCEYEIVVVDNGCTDASVDVLRQMIETGILEGRGVRIVDTHENIGYAQALNLAYYTSTGEYVMTLNPDMMPEPGAIDAMVRILEEDPSVGAVGPYAVHAKTRRFERYLNNLPTLRSHWLWLRNPKNRETRKAWRAYAVLDVDFEQPIAEVEQPAGQCIILRRSLFQNGFKSPDLGYYWSDVEICRKVKDQGLRSVVVRDAVWLHDHKPAAPGFSRESALVYLDALVGSVRYFRAYDGLLSAALVYLMNLAQYSTILTIETAACLLRQSSWAQWRIHAFCFWNLLLNRNVFLEERKNAIHAAFGWVREAFA